MYEIFKWIWEHRNQPLTWVTVISFLSLIIDKFGRKLITNQLKRLFHVKDKSDFAAYVENQKRIESKVDMLLEERGLSWDAAKNVSLINTEKNSLISSWAGRLYALTVGVFIQKGLTTISRGNRTMKEYLKKLGRTKFQAFLIATFTNVSLIIGYVLDVSDVQSKVSAWAPLYLAGAQLIAGIVYQLIEGSRDKAVAVGAAQVEIEKAKAEISVGDSGPAE